MTQKIKILETIRQGKIGGGETHVLELCTALDKSLFEPVVLSFTDGPMVTELRKRGIRTEIIYTEKAFDFKVWKQVYQFIKDEKFDIVHAHGTRAASNVFRAAKKAKVPMIYTVHGWSFHPDQSFTVRKLRELSEKYITTKADRTICVSKSNQKDGLERFNMKRSQVIYNAVDIEKFNPSNNFTDVRAELGIARDKTVFGYIVRLTGQKDPINMLNAMKIVAKQADNAVLLIVGDGDMKEQAMAHAQNIGIAHKVVFESFRTDIPNVLNAIDVYVLPSLWEGFPIGILEAMAMQKAVIASNVDGNVELVKDGETGLLVEPQNPTKLAEAMLLLHNDHLLRKALSHVGSYTVRNNFSIEPLKQSIEKVYSEILSRREGVSEKRSVVNRSMLKAS